MTATWTLKTAKGTTVWSTMLFLLVASFAPHELWAENLGWGGPIGDYRGFWGGPVKGYAANLVHGSHRGFAVQGLGFGGGGSGIQGCGGCRVVVGRVAVVLSH